MPIYRDNDELVLGEVLQTELVRRVMALEGREEFLRVNNEKLETTMEALDECTRVSREDIVEIARELSLSASANNGSDQKNAANSVRIIPAYTQAISSDLIIVLATVAFMFLRPEADSVRNILADLNVNAGEIFADGNAEIFYNYRKKAELVSSMTDVWPLRMMLEEYYYSEGDYPDSIDALGYDPSLLVSKNVTGVTLESKGTLVVLLPALFGNNKHIKLAPTFAMSGTIIEWDCMANLPSSVLVGTQCQQE